MEVSIRGIRSRVLNWKEAKELLFYGLGAAFTYLTCRIIVRKALPYLFSKLFDHLKYLATKTLGLTKRYGDNSWVFITDCSNSVGKSFIHELAREGFNILTITENYETAVKYKEEITKKFNVAYEIIQADLSTLTSYENVIKIIEEKALDISMLVNNTAYNSPSSFINLENQDIIKSVRLNCLLPVLFESYFLNKFPQRNCKSAIINVCGNWKWKEIFNTSVIFEASKSYLRDYTLSSQNNKKIDILCYEPDFPYIKITHNGVNVEVTYGESFVSGVLYELGKKKKTDGNSHRRCIITVTERRQD